MEPLADDHSSDGEDAPTGVEESAAPAAPAVAAAPEQQTTIMTPLCFCVARKMRLASPARACMSRVNRVVVVCCCFHVHQFHLCTCCVHLSSRLSPVQSLALRTGSNDQCDGNQCCPSFEGCPRWHHPGVELVAQCASTRRNSPGSDMQ